jgi:hypothetical protein
MIKAYRFSALIAFDDEQLELQFSPEQWMRDRKPLKQVKMGGISDHPDCPSNDRCNPEQMGGTYAL